MLVSIETQSIQTTPKLLSISVKSVTKTILVAMVENIPSVTSLGHSQPISCRSTSSDNSSLSSSRLEFGSVNPEIVRRNLVTDFLEATSLPVNVPIHKSREAIMPSTPMKEEFDRCTKQLTFSLACKLFSFKMEEDDVVNENVRENNGDPQEEKKGFCDDLIFRLE